MEASRNINETMVGHVVNLLVHTILRNNGEISGVILFYGLSFN